MDRPSKTKRTFWLIAVPKGTINSSVQSKTDCDAGIRKWLIYESRKNIDQAWDKIKGATESGQLTDIGAKVSTRKKKSAEIGGGTSDHVICIYTKDTEEHKDAVRQALYNLGFVRYLPYKTDAATTAGIYTKQFTPTKVAHHDDDSSEESDERPLSTSTSTKRAYPSPSTSSASSPKKEKLESPSSHQHWTPPTGNPIKVLITDNSAYRCNGQRFVHVQQLYPLLSGKPPDVLFPIDQFARVSQAFYTLSNTRPTREGSDKTVVVLDEEDLAVKIWGERVSQFDGKFSIVMQHKKNKKKVHFLQSDGIFCYKRLEWLRTKDDVDGEDKFSSEEKPDEEGDDENDATGDEWSVHFAGEDSD